MEASLFLDWLNSSGFSKTKKAFLKESKFDISTFSAPATNVREILATLHADKGDDSDSDSSSSDSSSDDDSSAAASAKVSTKPSKRARSSSAAVEEAPPAKKRKIDADNDSSSDDSDEDDDIKTATATPKDAADDASDSTASGDAKEPETEADAEPANTEDVYGAAPGTDADADATPGKASAGKETGVCVKWNHEKGFGFITRDNGKGDLFCHVNECWFSGTARNVKVGSKVEFEVEKGDKGEASVGVTGVGGVECEGGKQAAGTMKNWLEDKEFGFVQPDDGGDDMFVGNRDAFNTGSRFYQGDRVDFDIKVKADGRKQAVFVTLEGGICKLCNICEEYGHLSKDCPGEGGAPARPATPRAAAPVAPVHEKGTTPPPTEGKSTGVVRMWRHEKGFGFIKVDGKEEEVFAHVNDIYAPSGFRNAKVGSRVEFDYVENAEKGGSATEVHGIGGGDVQVGRSKGTMSRWLGDKGFGFIMPDDGGEELFTGDRDCWEASGGFNDGDRVEFDVKTKESGKVLATYVTLEGGSVLQCRTCEGVGYSGRDCPICNGTAEAGAEEGGEAW